MPKIDERLLEPGYRPRYTGDRGVGDVGSGRALGANLFALYRAGRNELPELAAVYAELVRMIQPVGWTVKAEFNRPGLGMDPVHQRLLDLREEVHDILRENCRRMLEVGQALVITADAYAATDQAAAQEFGKMLARSGEFTTESIMVPDPPATDAATQRPY